MLGFIKPSILFSNMPRVVSQNEYQHSITESNQLAMMYHNLGYVYAMERLYKYYYERETRRI